MDYEIEMVDGTDIQVHYQGTTTIAISGSGEATYVGVAKCNPIDKYSREIGRSIAIARAMKFAFDASEALWVSRASKKSEWNAKHASKESA